MKRISAAAVWLIAGCMFAAPMKQEGGDTVQLSTGEVVKVAYHDEFNVDRSTRKAAGGSTNLLFQASTGTRIALRSRDSVSRQVDTTIWSLDGSDRISFVTDLEFRRKGLPIPLTIDINGERFSFLLNGDAPSEDGRVRQAIAARATELSPDFVSALKELVRLGQGGYPHAGSGWIDAMYLFNPGDVGATASVASTQEMTAAGRQRFVQQFSPQ